MGSCGTGFSESPLALVLKVIVALLCIMETGIAKEGVQEVGRYGKMVMTSRPTTKTLACDG